MTTTDAMTITETQALVAAINVQNGWRENIDRDDVNWQITQLALIITEASEAIEELRNGRKPNEAYYGATRPLGTGPAKPEGVPSELADVVIRALDCADLFGINLAAAIEQKLAYNESRGYRHGGKSA